MRLQRRSSGLPIALALSLALATVACGDSELPSQSPLSLEEMAAAWSGGRTDPTCRTQGPRGEYLGPIPGAEHCQWPTVVRGASMGTVTGSRDSLAGFQMILWERTLPDSQALEALVDSLAAAFGRWELEVYPCPEGGRRWQDPGLGVQFTPSRPAADGRPRISITATVFPTAIPDLLCPGVPAPRSDGPPTRT